MLQESCSRLYRDADPDPLGYETFFRMRIPNDRVGLLRICNYQFRIQIQAFRAENS